jgi:hypothetical protein
MRDRVKLIIARYREDIAWVSNLGYDYVVYNKGGDTLKNSIVLGNIGREAHTYLSHIVREYDNLAYMNIFLQGDPFDHIDDRGRASIETLQSMLEDVVDKGAPFKGLAWFKLKCNHLGQPHDLRKPENEGRWAGWGKDIPVGEIFEKLFNAEAPDQIVARAPAGLFCVSGERIRTRPKAFYEYALQLVTDDPEDEGNIGHAFERLWQYIFNGNLAWNRDNYEK